ncbi:hypothetical protein MLD38_029108 [Melastoma candidum]|uniref:Uncharacterized protein n=1 Tax=Melastoma candidum TaxID=119954 RepID=A0ACB9N343_9MYRT|nr:hypothetical protein MLD38_029108 [Melastoma candidum]
MHYLHASLTETLRLYPAVPVDGKSALEDDVLPDGFKVKKGNVSIPERWLAEDGAFKPESPFKFNAFLAGPRICIGKEFAYRQMKIVAALLLNSFEFELVHKDRITTYRTMFTLHMDQGLHVYAYPRM